MPDSTQSDQGKTSPSRVMGFGVVLLFLTGIAMGLYELGILRLPYRSSPTPSPGSGEIVFDTSWPQGDPSSGEGKAETTFLPETKEFQIRINTPDTPVDAVPDSDVLFEDGLCLSVDAYTHGEWPKVYGLVFGYLDSGENSLYLSINERTEKVQLDRMRNSKLEPLVEPYSISDVLQDSISDGRRSICARITLERVDVWLNRTPILGLDESGLATGKVGVFAESGPEDRALPVRVRFRDFRAVGLSTDCPPKLRP